MNVLVFYRRALLFIAVLFDSKISLSRCMQKKKGQCNIQRLVTVMIM